MFTLHHLESSRSYRMIWLLHLLAIDFELITYQRDPETGFAPESLKQIHPLGKAPILQTPDGQTLVESGAITEYLTDHYDPDNKYSSRDYAYKFWLHYAEGSLMALVLGKFLFIRMSEAKVPFFIRPVINKIKTAMNQQFFNHQFATHLNYIEAHLHRHTYLGAEHFTAADIQNHFPLKVTSKHVGLEHYPAIQQYITRIEKQPGFDQTLEQLGGVDVL